MAVAAAFSASAFGVDFNAKYTTMEPVSVDKNCEIVAKIAPEVAKAPAKIQSAEKLSGVYYYSYYSGSSQNSGEQEGSVEVSINGTNATLTGLVFEFPVKGTFDPNTGNITIKPQDLAMNTHYNEMMKLYILKQYDDQLKPIDPAVYLDEVVFEYYPEGAQLQSGEVLYVGGWIAPNGVTLFVSCDSFKDQDSKGNTVIGGQGFAWHLINRMQTLEEVYDTTYFAYDDSEWKDAGTCEFTDGWFFERKYTYNVPLKAKKDGSKEYLLVNPYDNSAIAGLTAKNMGNTATDKKGYIYINAENPKCVLVRPFVTSGYENNALIGEIPITVLNKEGQKVYMEYYATDEVVDEFEGLGDTLSTMDENGKITIVNAVFAPMMSLPTPTAWQYEDGSVVDMTTYIQLPTAGVNDIIGDSENVAKRYFNLQGIEVANPAAGELVIVKEGNKTSKTIIR